jgi:hypothetical protein
VTKVKFNKEYTQYLKAQKVLKEKLLIKPLNYMLTDPPQNFEIALYRKMLTKKSYNY